MTRLGKRLGLIGVVILLIGGVSVGVWFLWMMTPVFPDTTTDVSQYEEILTKKWPYVDLVDHFPRTIPGAAKNVRMNFYPGFLQAGANFQLMIQLPAEDVKQIFSKYEKLATHRFTGGDVNDHANAPNGVHTTFFYTSGTDSRKFPNSFEVLVLDAKAHPDGNPSWNHGHSCGVAIDTSASEVVYWAECW